MFSEMFYKLWNNGLIQLGVWETIYMTLLSSLIAYLIGLPLGVVLCVTDTNGIRPTPWLNRVLGFVVNFFRSIPFIILMVAMLPVAKFIIGTSLGNGAVIVMLVIAAAPYVARMVESSVKEVSFGVIRPPSRWAVPICRSYHVYFSPKQSPRSFMARSSPWSQSLATPQWPPPSAVPVSARSPSSTVISAATTI